MDSRTFACETYSRVLGVYNNGKVKKIVEIYDVDSLAHGICRLSKDKKTAYFDKYLHDTEDVLKHKKRGVFYVFIAYTDSPGLYSEECECWTCYEVLGFDTEYECVYDEVYTNCFDHGNIVQDIDKLVE